MTAPDATPPPERPARMDDKEFERFSESVRYHGAYGQMLDVLAEARRAREAEAIWLPAHNRAVKALNDTLAERDDWQRTALEAEAERDAARVDRNRLAVGLRALEETGCLMDDPRRLTVLMGEIRPISTEKIGVLVRRLQKAEADLAAAREEIAALKDTIRSDEETIRDAYAVTTGRERARFDQIAGERDEAREQIAALRALLLEILSEIVGYPNLKSKIEEALRG